MILILLIMGGLILIPMGIIANTKAISIRRNYIKTTGEIVGFYKGKSTGWAEDSSNFYSDSLLTNICYTSETGGKHYHKLEKGFGEKVGNKVAIRYNPENPDKSIIYSQWQYEFKPLIGIFLGITMLSVAIIWAVYFL